ncbi:ATP-binding protein [Methylovirgula sp. 4M-Z18]|uniref:ATP-binding protein n=1 Tax=Methylovirgula sp. 4M-Z18 TaxID=2293567 RepID=UPI000E2F2F3A|nr:ATP-binding protein [Methylovirgula sp. 4M-Z18]RFB76401.1 sensor histidine kinase [Methylovirgula sp. 4M-Z18]
MFRVKAQSIATRLFLSAAFWSTVILVIAGFLLSAVYTRSAEQSFDEILKTYLTALVADIDSSPDKLHVVIDPLSEPKFKFILAGWYWQITPLGSDKPEIKTSQSLFAATLPRLSDQNVPLIDGAREGYVTGPGSKQLRQVEREIVFPEADPEGKDLAYLVQVAATTEEIDRKIFTFQVDLAITFVSLALALLASTFLQVRFGLRPLRQLRRSLGAIRQGNTERIEGQYPQDIAPLADEINLLIDSNREIVGRARTHVGNLAHALKTPLSVIVNEADAEAGGLAGKVREQAGIMRDQVDYYLERARAAARTNVIGAMTEVTPTIEGLVRAFAKINQDRDIRFEVAVAGGLRFRGERQDLEEMIGNLADNAAKWARHRVRIEAVPAHMGDTASRPFFDVTIDDDGAGLPKESRTAALHRGRRLDETKPGSGLGLSIVMDLVSVYGGTLKLEDSPLGGLRAQLHLPAIEA